MGKRNGYGKYTYASGDVYVGEYKDGKFHGKCTFTFNSGSYNGDVYVGEYKDGKKDGKGTYTWADGNVYVGEWKDNKRNGKGKYTYNSGRDKGMYMLVHLKIIRE